MYELVYADDRAEYCEIRDAVEKRYPVATIKDASDDVHPFRFSVEVDEEKDDFYKWAIGEGIFLCLLGGQLLLRTEPGTVKRWIEEAESCATT